MPHIEVSEDHIQDTINMLMITSSDVEDVDQIEDNNDKIHSYQYALKMGEQFWKAGISPCYLYDIENQSLSVTSHLAITKRLH